MGFGLTTRFQRLLALTSALLGDYFLLLHNISFLNAVNKLLQVSFRYLYPRFLFPVFATAVSKLLEYLLIDRSIFVYFSSVKTIDFYLLLSQVPL